MPTQKAIRRALIGPDIHPGRWPSHAPGRVAPMKKAGLWPAFPLVRITCAF
jgi:hypothetical protein